MTFPKLLRSLVPALAVFLAVVAPCGAAELPACAAPKACPVCATAAASCAAGSVPMRLPAAAFDAAGCATACPQTVCAPPWTGKAQPATRHEHPWPAAKIRPGHPRLYVDAERLARLRARWADPAWADAVTLYRDKPDQLARALQSLATGDQAACSAALAGLTAEKRADFGPPQATYGDLKALVFDWCYPVIPPPARAALAHDIDAANEERERLIEKRFQWHEAHYKGFHAYLMGVLAIEGEPGIRSRLATAQNVLQNWTEYANELHGDGTYKTYAYQDLSLVTPAVLFDAATDGDAVRRNRFLAARPEMLLRMLAPGGGEFWAGPGDQHRDGRGYLLQRPPALGPMLVASVTRSPLAAFAAETIRRANGWSSFSYNPTWLALLYADPAVKPAAPQAAGLAASRLLPAGGMVNFRSGWDLGEASRDVSAWFYLGPKSEHAESDAGHLTIVRGRDELVVNGANYFGTPSRYRDLWGGRSFARDTAVFSPAGAARPDTEGSQLMQLPPGPAAQRYPTVWRLVPADAFWQGEIADFRDQGGVVMAEGDATASYDPAHVRRYRRSVAYAPPGLFIVRDAFALSGVDRVRMLFHLRERPALDGARVVQGSAQAGIVESASPSLTLLRGDSRARIDLVYPKRSLTRLVGGPGFDQYIDGANVDPAKAAQDWLLTHPELPIRMQYVQGQWRAELEATPDDAGGEMIAAIVVSARGETPDARVAVTRSASGTTVGVTYAGRAFELRYPPAEDASRVGAACAP